MAASTYKAGNLLIPPCLLRVVSLASAMRARDDQSGRVGVTGGNLWLNGMWQLTDIEAVIFVAVLAIAVGLAIALG